MKNTKGNSRDREFDPLHAESNCANCGKEMKGKLVDFVNRDWHCKKCFKELSKTLGETMNHKIVCEGCQKEIKGRIYETSDGCWMCSKCWKELKREASINYPCTVCEFSKWNKDDPNDEWGKCLKAPAEKNDINSQFHPGEECYKNKILFGKKNTCNPLNKEELSYERHLPSKKRKMH